MTIGFGALRLISLFIYFNRSANQLVSKVGKVRSLELTLNFVLQFHRRRVRSRAVDVTAGLYK